MRLHIALGTMALVGALALSGCNTPSDGTAEEQESEQSSFQAVEATAGPSDGVTFEDANILSFELVNRDDESLDGTLATFHVSNSSDKDLDYFSVDFVYRDAEGNSLCSDGRFNDFGIAPGTYSVMDSYSWLDEGQTSDMIADIQVTGYDYQIDGTVYDVDLTTEKVNVYEQETYDSVDFDAANIVTFEYEDRGNNSIGAREVAVKATNNSTVLIPEVSIRMAYFDADGNLIGTDGRVNDDSMNPGTYVSISSFMMDEAYSPNVASFGIYSYDYQLPEDDANGYNHYSVNLKTGVASGSHVDI